MRSNCLFHAVRRWWAEGGYVLISKSRYGPFPHFMYSPDLRTFEAFVPLVAKRQRRFPPLWFAGKVRPMVIRKLKETP